MESFSEDFTPGDPTQSDEDVAWNFFNRLGEGFTALSSSIGDLIGETSDAIVDTLAPELSDDDDYSNASSDESSIELVDMSRQRHASLNDASRALDSVKSLRRTQESLHRRGEGLSRLEKNLEQSAMAAREMRQNAARLRELQKPQSKGCCALM